MPCAIATAVAAATLFAGPMCPRTDRGPVPTIEGVMAALRGEAPPSSVAVTDPGFAAAIRSIKPAATTKAAPRRKHRR